MRAKRLKRITQLDESAQINKKPDVIKDLLEEPQSSRPIRKRNMTKKIEESYSSLQSIPNTSNTQQSDKKPSTATNIKKTMRTKRQTRQSRQKQSPIDSLQHFNKLIKSDDECSNNEFNGTTEEKDFLYQQYLCRDELFKSQDSSQFKIKEEPLSDDEEELELPKRAVKLTRGTFKNRQKKLKKPELKNRMYLREGSIFDDYRLRPPKKNTMKKPEMPETDGRVIEPDQVRDVLRALVQSQEINFRRPNLEKSFGVVQASVVKYAPGFLPLFIDIMKDTQNSMRNCGYFDFKEPVRSGEDNLFEMLMDLKNLRLNHAKNNIKQELK